MLVTTGDEQLDERVRQLAAMLSRRGLTTTILAASPSGLRGESRVGNVRVRRVPLGTDFRDWGRRVPRSDANGTDQIALRETAPIRLMALKRQWAGLDHRRLPRSWWDLRLGLARRWPTSRALVEWGWTNRDRDISQVLDLEVAMAAEIDSLRPDFVHVGAACLLPAVRAKGRAANRGERLQVLYDSTLDAHSDSGWTSAGVAARLSQHFEADVDAVLQSDEIAGSDKELTLDRYRALGATVSAEEAAWPTGDEPERLPLPARADGGPVFGMGPTNSAGQAAAWTRAAGRRLGVGTRVVAIRSGSFAYPADVIVSAEVFARDGQWQRGVRDEVLSTWTHALVEAGRPLFGTLNGSDFRADVAEMRDAGIHVGLAFHGSEVRDPRRHRESHEFSPFADPNDEFTRTLQERCDRLLDLIATFDGPEFVSTLDLLDYVPEAAWLPVTVDLEALPAARPVATAEPPMVVHAPSNPLLKGTDAIESVLVPLAETGRIRYRRLQGITPAEVEAAISDADVVVDQVLLGLYGHLACVAMAMGRCVIGNVGPSLRERSPAEVPIIEANPETLAAQMAELLANREMMLAQGMAGRDFVDRFHNGDAASEALRGFLLSGNGGQA